MSTVDYKVVNSKGKEVASMSLSAGVFGVRPHEASVHAVVRWQLAKRRAGTHQALTRSMIEGGKKKPFQQKHTGRARQGSTVGPHMVGGAVVFGPLPRSYEHRVPKRVRRLALASVLSDKVKAGNLVIVDNLSTENGKTKDFAAQLKAFGIKAGRVLVVCDVENELLTRAARNIPEVKILPVEGVNVYDVLHARYLVGSKSAIAALEKRCAGSDGEKA
ncbi:MAG: 50S ribosomal protein L4 [Bdellovibrionota bacterium]|nr:MAG: 50S ribosomal protein L4 [Bdellovibrionota bacterium]